MTYEKFLEEAHTLLAHEPLEVREAWAAQCVSEHPGFKDHAITPPVIHTNPPQATSDPELATRLLPHIKNIPFQLNESLESHHESLADVMKVGVEDLKNLINSIPPPPIPPNHKMDILNVRDEIVEKITRMGVSVENHLTSVEKNLQAHISAAIQPIQLPANEKLPEVIIKEIVREVPVDRIVEKVVVEKVPSETNTIKYLPAPVEPKTNYLKLAWYISVILLLLFLAGKSAFGQPPPVNSPGVIVQGQDNTGSALLTRAGGGVFAIKQGAGLTFSVAGSVLTIATSASGGAVGGSSNLITAGAVNCTQSTGVTGECDPAKLFWDNTNKRLGIGTNAPGAMLDISGTLRATNQIAPSTGAGLEFGYTGGTGFIRGFDRGGSSYQGVTIDASIINLDVAGVPKLSVAASGNVLLGNTPTDGNYRFDVQKSGSTGTARFYDQTSVTGATSVLIQAGAGDASGAKLLRGVLNDGTTEKWSITRDGTLSVSGNINAFGGTFFGVATNTSLIQTSGNCSSATSPAVCGSSAAGSVVVAAAATTVTVNTTAVTANSQILVQYDASLGTKLAVTCNTTAVTPTVTARVAATSFTITVGAAPVTNPACFSYTVIN